jgi:hypothetical protein
MNKYKSLASKFFLCKMKGSFKIIDRLLLFLIEMINFIKMIFIFINLKINNK